MNTGADDSVLFVGNFWDGKDWQFLPMSQREVARSADFIGEVLDTYPIPERSLVLVAANFDQRAMSLPLENALTGLKHVIINADSTAFEAGRIESIMRLFKPKVVFGISHEVLLGLSEKGLNVGVLFSDCLVFTRDAGANRMLREFPQIQVRQFNMLGPIVTIECAHGGAVHYDDCEWKVHDGDAELKVSSLLRLRQPIVEQCTGARMRRMDELCPCGMSSSRLVHWI